MSQKMQSRNMFFSIVLLQGAASLRFAVVPLLEAKVHEHEEGCGLWSGPPSGLAEANLQCKDISQFGATVRKWPVSMVNCIAALKEETGSTKTHNYNFQGSLEQPGCKWWKPNDRRHWLLDFSKKHFSDNDVIIFTDVDVRSHSQLGLYDHSNENRKKWTPCHIYVDVPYYQTMIRSNFTLTPGGDLPFSWRFYEAILAGSIPVINSEKQDNDSPWMGVAKIGYKVFTTDEVVNMKALSSAELKSIADENYNLFIKYQTFLHGDQVPPASQEMSKPCIADERCAKRIQGQCK